MKKEAQIIIVGSRNTGKTSLLEKYLSKSNGVKSTEIYSQTSEKDIEITNISTQITTMKSIVLNL